MTLLTKGLSSVFCDWLDATTPPDREHTLRSELGAILCGSGGSNLTDELYDLGGGKVKLSLMRGVFRVSVSGTAVRVLLIQGLWGSFLSQIGDGPHRVTRLDAAVDFDEDGADSIEALQLAYPRGEVRLSRRSIKVTEMLCTRPDGRKTGTWYAGHRSAAEITCRVYDKAQQMLDVKGELCPPRTRAELTVRKGCTLRDVYEPERVFWHYMAPAIIQRPSGVPEWSSGWAEGWTMEKVDLLPAQRLKALIERSPDLAAIVELADVVGPYGRSMAMRLIEQKVKQTPAVGSPAGFSGFSEASGS
jgi:hypothetical protein